ncbi:hypothetical protein D3C80_1805140 [compost metagenome]
MMLLLPPSCTVMWLLPRPIWFWVVVLMAAAVCLTSAMFSVPVWFWVDWLLSAMTWPARARTMAALRGASLNMVVPPGLTVLVDLHVLPATGLNHGA